MERDLTDLEWEQYDKAVKELYEAESRYLVACDVFRKESEDTRYIELTGAATALMEAKKVLTQARWKANPDS